MFDTPPFRADHVGSLLRPESITAARKAHFEDGTMSAEELKDVEDAAIPDLIRMQQDAGLKAVTYDDQRRKLDLVVATAEAIWGEV